MYQPALTGVVAAAVSYLVVKVVAPHMLRYLKSRGIVRPDAHKPGKPEVVHAGGVIIFIGVLSGLTAWLVLQGLSASFLKGLVVMSAAAVCFGVGLVDDLKVLGGLTKTALTILGIVPIALTALLDPHLINWGRPALPVIGQLRITLIYWILLPLAVAGPANVVNMLDVLNGITPGTMLVAFSTLALISAFLGRETALILSLLLVGVLAAYYPYNAYPARVFNGDSGSLFLGALLGGLAVVEHLEFIALTLLLPHVVNGFMVLVSFRGFREHRTVPERPVIVEPDGTLRASRSPKAPLTLTRLALLIGGDGREEEVVKLYILLELTVAALALLSAFLML